jgi:arylsulfatase A-like enzyme
MNGPNIVFVFGDQHRYSALGCNGNKVVKTPVFDRIAAEGINFDAAFSSCPICSPYRASLLSGLYAHQNGVICNEYKMKTDIPTLPGELKKGGYRSAYIGKWHLGEGPYDEKNRYGFDYMAAGNCFHHYYNCQYYINETGPFIHPEWEPAASTNYAIDFINDHVKKYPGQPFMMMMSWTPPHWPYQEYPEEFNIYKPPEVDLPANVPVQMADFARGEIANYYGMVSALDAEMGRLMDTLKQLRIEENTIVIYTSDHGDHLSSHGYVKPMDRWMHHSMRGSKATPFEESIHVPWVMKWPGHVKEGTHTDVMFNSVDIMPTLLALCGLPVPKSAAGRDLSFAALGKEGNRPDSVYLQILGTGWPDRLKWLGFWRGIRTERWTYARWWHDEVQARLYDREADPLEMCNLFGNPAYADIQARLEARLRQWMRETNDPFDWGERDELKHILKLGQVFTNDKWNKN